jgi:hypothetical protein
MTTLNIPAQTIDLFPVADLDGMWHGCAQIGCIMFHVEAYGQAPHVGKFGNEKGLAQLLKAFIAKGLK